MSRPSPFPLAAALLLGLFLPLAPGADARTRPGAPALATDLDFTFAGEAAGRTIVRGRLTVPAGEVDCSGPAGDRTCAFLLSGRVDGAATPPQSFHYRLSVPAPAPGAGIIEVAFERRLAPGDYRLELRLEDLGAHRLFRAERDFSVPRMLRV